MLDITKIRAHFPHLARCVYLNTAAAGLSWAGQGEAAAEFYGSSKALGMGGAVEWAAKVTAARSELGSLLHVPPQCLHFVGSTTEALNLLASSLPLQRGDRVVVAQDEFPSVVHAWLTWQSKGVELIQVPIAHETDRTAALCAAVRGGVRALAVSHIHWRTGTRVDLAQLSARCREYDCRLIVDGVQAIGAVPVQAGVVDAYCASVFKWLLSGFGLGFVALSEQLAGELQPVLRGYNNEPPSRTIAYSHVNYPGVYALLASLEYLRSIGWEGIFSRVDALALRTIAALRGRGFDVMTPESAHGGIVSIQHPAASDLVRALATQSIVVEDRDTVLRASPHFYNTEEDVDRFVSALARIA
jgi:cysteine desulfurase / selenocysteine lyase